jgi:hypothetical protein
VALKRGIRTLEDNEGRCLPGDETVLDLRSLEASGLVNLGERLWIEPGVSPADHAKTAIAL